MFILERSFGDNAHPVRLTDWIVGNGHRISKKRRPNALYINEICSTANKTNRSCLSGSISRFAVTLHVLDSRSPVEKIFKTGTDVKLVTTQNNPFFLARTCDNLSIKFSVPVRNWENDVHVYFSVKLYVTDRSFWFCLHSN